MMDEPSSSQFKIDSESNPWVEWGWCKSPALAQEGHKWAVKLGEKCLRKMGGDGKGISGQRKVELWVAVVVMLAPKCLDSQSSQCSHLLWSGPPPEVVQIWKDPLGSLRHYLWYKMFPRGKFFPSGEKKHLLFALWLHSSKPAEYWMQCRHVCQQVHQQESRCLPFRGFLDNLCTSFKLKISEIQKKTHQGRSFAIMRSPSFFLKLGFLIWEVRAVKLIAGV